MDPTQHFKSMQERIQAALVITTKLTNHIVAEDVDFHRTSDPDVEEQLDDATSRLLELATSLLSSSTKETDLKAPSLEDSNDVDVHWSHIVDVVDTLLEKSDTCLDEYTGVIKRKTAPTDQSGTPTKKPKSAMLATSMRHANINKPQKAFQVKPNNLDTPPWRPILTKKPHAITPLEKSLVTFRDEDQTIQYRHPYETEILNLEYPGSVFEVREPIKYQPVGTTAATFVDTFEGVLDMLQELRGAKEIAIDTEHHDFRTYHGLLSLMQISTREKDWIIDTLQPWRHKLEILNEVFADPKIVKVLHGAYMDIIWLQRDCGIYIVGLFDTYEASVALQYSGRSLAYLLKRFVNFDADKKYQLADWRIRPIPEEMFYYARSDTHYLLYIYDMMRNQLMGQSENLPGQNLIRQVLKGSTETSLRRHETFIYDSQDGQGPSGWYSMLIRNSCGSFSKQQFAVFRALHQWRDETARREDESPQFIMTSHALFSIAQCLPPDPKALHSLLDPSSHIAKRDALNLSRIINKANAEGANGPSLTEVIRKYAPPTIGIGEVAKMNLPRLQSKNTGGMSDVSKLVSQTTKLWGNIPMSSRWEKPSDVKVQRAMQFELPWAKFVKSSKVLEADEQPQRPSTDVDGSFISLAEPKQLLGGALDGPMSLFDDEFTLKAGLKRKAPVSNSDAEEGEVDETPSKKGLSSDTSAGAEQIAVPDMDDSEEQSRRSKKKAKKAAKKAREEALREERRIVKMLSKRAKNQVAMEATEASERGEGQGVEEEPFNYSEAKSVLKASRAINGTPHPTKFNPYGMTVEGPKPARKMHGEKAGKSATFKK
ncbi:ribonuclease H-like domain-containing protein [Hypoxylon sp. NC1633]|nr:ribonuclease H-like domain-containing protein [Hypoxylon sp. NC1633]